MSSTAEIENKIKQSTNTDCLLNMADGLESVGAYIKRIMKEKNINAVDIINVSSNEKSYVYQMLNCKRNPTRKFLLGFGIIAGLSVDEEQRLLKLAEKTPLYVKRRYDAVIYYALCHALSIDETNCLLYDLGEETL